MSFLDKAKEKASQLTSQVKDKVDDMQGRKKADDLLDDIGRIIFRQRSTGTTEPGDDAAIDALVEQLTALQADGVDILQAKPEPDVAPPASTLPPPAPPAPLPMPEPG